MERKNVKLARSLWEIEERFLKEHITCWLPKLCNTICEKQRLISIFAWRKLPSTLCNLTLLII